MTLTSWAAVVRSLSGAAGPSLQPASSPANSRAITLLWSTKRAVILLQPHRCCSPQACAAEDALIRAHRCSLNPDTFLVSGFAGSSGILLFSPFLEQCAAQREKSLAARGKPPGKPSREWEGTQLGNFVLGQI